MYSISSGCIRPVLEPLEYNNKSISHSSWVITAAFCWKNTCWYSSLSVSHTKCRQSICVLEKNQLSYSVYTHITPFINVWTVYLNLVNYLTVYELQYLLFCEVTSLWKLSLVMPGRKINWQLTSPLQTDWRIQLWKLTLLGLQRSSAFHIGWHRAHWHFLGKTVKSDYWFHVCPFIHMQQLGSQWTYFHYIWYLSIFRKSIQKIQIRLKSNMNNGYITWKPIYIYNNISMNSS